MGNVIVCYDFRSIYTTYSNLLNYCFCCSRMFRFCEFRMLCTYESVFLLFLVPAVQTKRVPSKTGELQELDKYCRVIFYLNKWPLVVQSWKLCHFFTGHKKFIIPSWCALHFEHFSTKMAEAGLGITSRK
jgi:hypothetical protein